MNIQELADKITEWEHHAGESFTDNFMHDNVKDYPWAFWLLGKGFNERANYIIARLMEGETCLDQELLYEPYPTRDEHGLNWSVEEYEKNVLLWAEFLLATPYYHKKVTRFFDKQN